LNCTNRDPATAIIHGLRFVNVNEGKGNDNFKQQASKATKARRNLNAWHKQQLNWKFIHFGFVKHVIASQSVPNLSTPTTKKCLLD